LIKRTPFHFFCIVYVISTFVGQNLLGPSIKILPILPIVFSDTIEVCPLVLKFRLRH
jgi:hypothetical protein